MKVTITLPIPARALWPNARPHWAAKAKAVRTARNLAWIMARQEQWYFEPRPPMWERAETRVVFYFGDRRVRDMDGAQSSLKSYWDGIADAGIVANDAGLIHHPPEMRYDKDRPRVEIELTPI